MAATLEALRDTERGTDWIVPNLGFQWAFLACSADIAIGGGAGGAGKSFALVLDPLRHIHDPEFAGLIVRKDEIDLEKPDSPWAKAQLLYPRLGGVINVAERRFTFPSGASIQFGYVGRHYEEDYRGTAFTFLGVDEGTHFTRAQIFYLLSRNRSSATCTVRAYARITCNPDPDSWLADFLRYWIGTSFEEQQEILPERCKHLRFFCRKGNDLIWGDNRAELARTQRRKPRHVKSVAFIPGRLADNQYLGEDYEGNLLLQDEHQVQQLLYGNWHARAAKAGQMFWRSMFHPVDAAPDDTEWVRAWDLGATSEEEARKKGGTYSFTAGPKIGFSPSARRYYFGDLVFGQWDAGDVELIVSAVAGKTKLGDLPEELQAAIHTVDGKGVKIWFCKERAGAGKFQLKYYVRLLAGWTVDGDVETGDKPVRLGPLSSQAKQGNVCVVSGPWNDTLFEQLEHLPALPDDVGDAAGAGFDQLTQLSDGEEDAEQMVSEMAGGLREPEADDEYPEELEESYDRGSFSW